MELLIVFSIIIVVLVGIGTYIRVTEATWLLANFPKNPAQVTDKGALARWASWFFYILAGILMLEGWLTFRLAETKYEMVPLAIGIPVIEVITIIFIAFGQRFVNYNVRGNN
jgi:hypothetical protein